MTASDEKNQVSQLSEEAKQIVQVLSLEYSALRSDILHRSSARYSLVGVFLGVAALLVALIDNKISGMPTGLVILLVYVITVLLYYFDAGRSIGRLSNRLVELEDAINKQMGRSLLVWERKQQEDRGPIHRHLMGKGISR